MTLISSNLQIPRNCIWKPEELERRRKVVFDKFLRPALLRSVKEPQIDDGLKILIHFVFDQSAGPLREENARASYQEAFGDLMKECRESIGSLYGKELERLCGDPDMSILMNFKKMIIHPKLQEKDLNHGRFMKPPLWALKKDLAGAVRGLRDAGVIDTMESFCLLIQQGRNPLLPTPDPKLFSEGPSSLNFWIALVLLWSIGIQKMIEKEFERTMFGLKGNASFRNPGVKEFPRSYAKALEYLEKKKLETWEEKVCAGLHVIDGLRCSYVVKSVKENIDLGRRLEERFPVVARSKNSHQRDNRSYADRKYNLVYSTTAYNTTADGKIGKVKEIGKVAFLCEVQILMERYIEIKKIGHLLYEFEREMPSIKAEKAARLNKLDRWVSSSLERHKRRRTEQEFQRWVSRQKP